MHIPPLPALICDDSLTTNSSLLSLSGSDSAEDCQSLSRDGLGLVLLRAEEAIDAVGFLEGSPCGREAEVPLCFFQNSLTNSKEFLGCGQLIPLLRWYVGYSLHVPLGLPSGFPRYQVFYLLLASESDRKHHSVGRCMYTYILGALFHYLFNSAVALRSSKNASG
jgi:hypothetical protein